MRKLQQTDFTASNYAEYDEQFAAVALLLFVVLLIDMCLIERKNRFKMALVVLGLRYRCLRLTRRRNRAELVVLARVRSVLPGSRAGYEYSKVACPDATSDVVQNQIGTVSNVKLVFLSYDRLKMFEKMNTSFYSC